MAERIVRGYGLHERLKEAGSNEPKPSWLVAFDGDGGEVKISITEARNKWARVMLALREVAWQRVDVFDKKGGLVFRHQRNQDDRDAPAGELEDLPPTRAMSELAGLMNVVGNYMKQYGRDLLQGQEMVLQRHHETVKDKDASLMKLVELTLKRFETQEEQLQQQMHLNHTLSADLVNAQLAQLQLPPSPPQVDDEGNPRPHSDRAVDAIIPHVIQQWMKNQQQQQQRPSGKTDTPKNGTPKNGASPKSTATGPRPESSTQPPHE